MRYRTALLPSLVIVLSSLSAAQGQEFARVLRNGQEATLSVFGPRPVDLAAKKLVDEFGVAINVEDPVYLYRDDVDDITPPRIASLGRRLLIPKAALLEIRFDLGPDGFLRDVRKLLQDLVETANAQLPFLYRLDSDGDVFTLVATHTRDEQGRSVELIPILDRHVTIPLGTRKIFEHVNVLTQELEQQTGVHVGCCQGVVGGVAWGSTVVSFEARDEPARSAFLRLLRSDPAANRLARGAPDGAYAWLMGSHWLLRCQPGQSWCFINVAPITDKR